MRRLVLALVLVMSSFTAGAFADEQAAANNVDNSPQCMPIQLDGKTTTACFNLSDEQVQGLSPEEDMIFFRHHCEIQCLRFDAWGRCRFWHRVCW